MVAVRPVFHSPALLAKQAANIDHISGGRLSLNVVSAWWATEARQYGADFDEHDDRYARTAEWIEVVDLMWSQERTTFSGRYYDVRDAILEPKPVRSPRPTLEEQGVDLLLLQFSPQLEEMERFTEEVIPLVNSSLATT